MSRDHPNYSIVEIAQNTEKSPGDLGDTFCNSISGGKPSANAGVKNSQTSKNNNNRELQKLWNMKLTIIPIVIDAFGTVTKGLLKRLEDLEIRGRVETI